MSAEFVVNILIQIPLIAIGIVGLFFIYGITVEKQLIMNQLNEAAVNITSSFAILLPEQAKALLRANFNLPSPTASGDDRLESRNKELRHKVTVGVAAIVSIFSVLIIIMLLVFQLPFPWKSLVEALIITGCLMFMEFLFLTIVTANYQVIYLPGVYAKILSKITVST